MTELPNIGKPATNALQNIGITTLEQLTAYDEKNLLKIHGVGPKALTILKEALNMQQLTFKESLQKIDLPNVNFAILCPISCENAPKKRVIRDYLIASAAGDQDRLETLVADSLTWIVPGKTPLEGRTPFIKTVLTQQQDLSSLDIQSILTHGREASAHGILTDTKGNKTYFSDIYLFANSKKEAKISQITSFVLTDAQA